ncbi:nuclease-related domain-containing protein [Gracilibacillus marinus]|uniref:Nuclease-related domain-containing protein n=1 Tax=Gracilibacillus marinus TaxID=630535 RepID=A0ABV8VU09_9BACI
MIIKYREEPESIQLLQNGLIRVPSRRKELETSLRNIKQGYEAECEMDFYLKRITSTHKNILILQDLRLRASDNNSYFQMDNLLLTPGFGLIIDIKDSQGCFHFSQFGRNFDYSINDRFFEMRNPIRQVEEQHDQLQRYFDRQLRKIPIIPIVALANPLSKILTDESSNAVHQQIMSFEHIKSFFQKLCATHSTPLIQTSLMTHASEQLIAKHKNPTFHYYKKFKIDRREVIDGIICSSCNYIGMKRIRGTWICPQCNLKERDAHIHSLKEYFAFVGPTVTNQQLREFFQVDNEKIIRNLLKNSGIVKRSGDNKGSIYRLL